MKMNQKVILATIGTLTIIGLSGCGKVKIPSTQAAQLTPKQEKELKAKLKLHPFPKTYTQSYNDYLRDVDGQHATLSQNTKSLQKQYHGLFKVKYEVDDNQITLQPTNKQVIKLIQYAKTGNAPTKKAAITNWHQFVSGVNETSKSVTKASGDGDVKMTIVDPHKPNQPLYTVENGQVVYDKFGTPDANIQIHVKKFDPFVS